MEIIDVDQKYNVLITGVAGFIGSNLAEACLELGFYVRGIDNFYNGRRENITELLKNESFEFVEGDICDYKLCESICKDIDFVFHEAAWGAVPKSIVQPLDYTKNNILGTHNILHSAYMNNVKGVIYASSASVYGDNDDKVKIIGNEGNVLSPYALSKKANEETAVLYYNLYGLKTVGLRYFNVFGRKQNPYSEYSAVIPKFIKAILENKEIKINGNGEQSRDFTYIDNVIEANLRACVSINNAAGQIFNVGFGESTSVNKLYKLISNLLKKDTIVKYVPERKGDIKNSLSDISKTKRVLKYNPKYNIQDGLKKTIEWYLKNLNHEKNF